MGAFRLLVCNIRNSCLPVCRLLPVRDVPIGADETRAPCDAKVVLLVSAVGQDVGLDHRRSGG